ncbi:MAG: 3'(2'),5'-bisphosphate nucleotidase CysQ [Candidatus Muirbacterium halophilum]|nr:3'(2'),5'-bisphosphate nucleotidase CysQ [Candidatus Muirbacterium halophilum]MCK9476410.1 3'(2'),5'-bisphosphate nucleotidase CysQ [Candidatus Muirbacterium halophilum]
MLELLKIAKKAGDAILEVYNTDFDVENKADNSPLTLADKKSNDIIVSFLKSYLFKDEIIPILSEEERAISFSERKRWNRFWIVDPLDGTKEFVKKNGEFTVNIGLIQNNYPILGIIYVPVKNTYFFAKEGMGSYFFDGNVFDIDSFDSIEMVLEKSEKLKTIVKNSNEKVFVVASRSHLNKETENFINELKGKFIDVDIKSSGSSLKFCLVAQGEAQFYPRFAPTMEWDTAAGQCIVEMAGGGVFLEDGKTRFHYNKKELVNPWFLVKG